MYSSQYSIRPCCLINKLTSFKNLQVNCQRHTMKRTVICYLISFIINIVIIRFQVEQAAEHI